MTISVHGIGWLTKEGYGCIRSGLRQNFAAGNGPASLSKKGIFSHPFKNFGRLDALSKTAAYGVALALQDAGIEYSPVLKQDIGLIGTSKEGSLRTDIEYFKDYIEGGRTLSRGNLFIYTLPSSPLGEAAIHFGLTGPLLYSTARRHSLLPLLDMATGAVHAGEARFMIVGAAEEDEAVFIVIANSISGHDGFCSLSDARTIVDAASDAAGMIEKFSLAGKKGKA